MRWTDVVAPLPTLGEGLGVRADRVILMRDPQWRSRISCGEEPD